jgi:hypothetical protein
MSERTEHILYRRWSITLERLWEGLDRVEGVISHEGRGKRMFENRRRFLAVLAGAGAPLALFGRGLAAQGRGSQASPPPVPHSPDNSDAREPESPNAKSATKAVLEANDKNIKKDVEKLYALASELKAEVEKTDSVQVLSLGLLKKAEEIERLAHEIKSRAKG